jgi:hypothetical protein
MNNDETFISFNGCTKDRLTMTKPLLALMGVLKVDEQPIFSTSIKVNKGFIIVHLSLVHPLKLIKVSSLFIYLTKDR